MVNADNHQDPTLETILDALGITWALTLVDTHRIDWDATAGHQIRDEGVNPEVVERYAAAIQRGENLPAGFATATDTGVVVCGGEHRARAHRDTGTDRVPMYLVEGDPGQIALAAIRHNTVHGQGLSDHQRARIALELIDTQGMTQTQAAAVVGLAGNQVHRAVKVRQGTARATRSGLNAVWSALGLSSRYAIASATAGDDDDELFAEIVRVVNNCDAGFADVQQIIAGVKAATDPFQYLEDYESQGHAPIGGGSGGWSSAAVQLRSACMKISDLDPADVAGSVTPSFQDNTVAMVKRAATNLARIAIQIEQHSEP